MSTFAPGVTGNGSSATQIGSLINVFLSVNKYLGSSGNGTAQTVLSITNLPIGIWIVSYQVRYINTTGTSTINNLATALLPGSTYTTYAPFNCGWYANGATQNISNTANVASGTFILNNTLSSQIITLADFSSWSGTGNLAAYGNDSTTGNTQTYLQAVRIG